MMSDTVEAVETLQEEEVKLERKYPKPDVSNESWSQCLSREELNVFNKCQETQAEASAAIEEQTA